MQKMILLFILVLSTGCMHNLKLSLEDNNDIILDVSMHVYACQQTDSRTAFRIMRNYLNEILNKDYGISDTLDDDKIIARELFIKYDNLSFMKNSRLMVVYMFLAYYSDCDRSKTYFAQKWRYHALLSDMARLRIPEVDTILKTHKSTSYFKKNFLLL